MSQSTGQRLIKIRVKIRQYFPVTFMWPSIDSNSISHDSIRGVLLELYHIRERGWRLNPIRGYLIKRLVSKHCPVGLLPR